MTKLEAYLDQTYGKRANRSVEEFALEALQTERANAAHWSNLLNLQLAANGMAEAIRFLESKCRVVSPSSREVGEGAMISNEDVRIFGPICAIFVVGWLVLLILVLTGIA